MRPSRHGRRRGQRGRLYYEEHGRGEPILCIHGAPSSALLWEGDPIRGLTALGRVIIYDRRGYARSERPEPAETSVAQQAEDAAALLDALDAVPAVVIGRSYGGDTAIELALRFPDRVRALVLLEGAPALDEESRRWLHGLQDEVEAAAARDPGSAAETLLRHVVGDETWEAFPEPLQQMFADTSPTLLAELRALSPDTTYDLARIGVPTLLVAATESLPFFRRDTELAAAAIPGARTVLVGGGHMVDPSGPEVVEFVAAVLAG